MREIYLIVELNTDLTDVVPGTRRLIIDSGMGEGHHFYKINGKYFIVSAMPGAHTDMVVARARLDRRPVGDRADGQRASRWASPRRTRLRTAGPRCRADLRRRSARSQ